MREFFTVGMAGHIDHGKTTLTKALTGVETDRLKEEKLRNISIEPGYAPLVQTDELQISIIDVPGHERFIRQMIAGVAGIDFVVLVIAADEGVMPQTREHIAILTLLGIERGMIAVTKVERTEQELLEIIQSDIADTVAGTFLENAPLYFVDSVTQKGIEKFKSDLIETVKKQKKRSTFSSFRLPVDDVFTVKGQGVVVRGTVFDGQVRAGDDLVVLPSEKRVRVRQMQSHHEQKQVVYAGQRVAINLGGVSRDEIKRGHVLVKDNFYTSTSRIDVSFTPLEKINHEVKQRQQIKLYVGTSEVTGKIIFFDRNELQKENNSEVLCQIQLDEAVVVTRGDRFIIRRASPIETIGGGMILEPRAERHRFGKETVQLLQQMKRGTAKDRITSLLDKEFALTKPDILRLAGVTEDELGNIKHELIEIDEQVFTSKTAIERVIGAIESKLIPFHQTYPLRLGINRAELISELLMAFPETLIEFVLLNEKTNNIFRVTSHTVALQSFTPTFPPNWKKRIESALNEWEAQGADMEKMTDIFSRHEIPKELHTDLYYFLLHTDRAYEFDEGRLMPQSIAKQLKDKLYRKTDGSSFSLQIARDITTLSRKNLVPLLELFDRLGYTKRENNERVWLL